jgi:hypothetical protein
MPFGIASKTSQIGVAPMKAKKLGMTPTYTPSGASGAKKMPKGAQDPVKAVTAQFEKAL